MEPITRGSSVYGGRRCWVFNMAQAERRVLTALGFGSTYTLVVGPLRRNVKHEDKGPRKCDCGDSVPAMPGPICATSVNTSRVFGGKDPRLRGLPENHPLLQERGWMDKYMSNIQRGRRL